MLVLSRKMSESVVIKGDIVVTVLEIRGDKVRLGITAPRTVPVFRQELLQSVQSLPEPLPTDHSEPTIATPPS
jgi:carbon storage regulator